MTTTLIAKMWMYVVNVMLNNRQNSQFIVVNLQGIPDKLKGIDRNKA